MTSLTLSFFGPPEQKHVVKVPPMQTLREALHAASTKFKPTLDAPSCQLHHNKKAVDMDTPFRLLNIPAGSKLEIFKKATTGPSPAPAAPPPAAVSAPATTSQASYPPPAAAAAAETPSLTQQHAQALPRQEPALMQSKQVAFAQPQEPAVVSAAVSQQAAAGKSASEAVPPASTTAQASSSAPLPPELAALGIDRAVYVFHQRVLEAAATAARSTSNAMDTDPPDEFFELTADDLARIQQQASARKQQEAVFRTRAAREAEEARAAAAMGPVRVRLHWPDGTLLQAEFKATEQLAKVQELVCKCAALQYAPAVYLYTTPPKTVLKDAAATLYQLQLVPAAHIYVGIDDKKVKTQGSSAAGSTAESSQTQAPLSYLRAEVQALMQDHVPESQQQQPQQQDVGEAAGSDAAAVAAAQRALRAAAASSRSEAAGVGAGEKKVPKWLKMGKK